METVKVKSFSIACQTEMKRRLNLTQKDCYWPNLIWLSRLDIPSQIYLENDFKQFAKSLHFKSKVHHDFAFYCFKYGYLNAVNQYFDYRSDEELFSLFFDFCASSEKEIYPNGYTQAHDWFVKGYKLALYQRGKFVLSAINDNIRNKLNIQEQIRLPYYKRLDNEFEGLIIYLDPELTLSMNGVKMCYCAIAFKIGRLLALNLSKKEVMNFVDVYFGRLFVDYFGADKYVLDYFDWFKTGVEFV